MSLQGYDIRGVANFVLELADEHNLPVTNLALNKILYFLHVVFLHETKRPLVSAKIEAWQHGPVFREIYHQFKCFGKAAISAKATKIDPMTGNRVEVKIEMESSEQQIILNHCIELLKIRPSALVDMSHVEDGAWFHARFSRGSVNPGIEITNELIMELSDRQSRH